MQVPNSMQHANKCPCPLTRTQYVKPSPRYHRVSSYNTWWYLGNGLWYSVLVKGKGHLFACCMVLGICMLVQYNWKLCEFYFNLNVHGLESHLWCMICSGMISYINLGDPRTYFSTMNTRLKFTWYFKAFTWTAFTYNSWSMWKNIGCSHIPHCQMARLNLGNCGGFRLCDIRFKTLYLIWWILCPIFSLFIHSKL